MVSRETLRRYPLFAKQSIYMLDEMSYMAHEVELEAGEWLFNERDDATHLYIIVAGAISLCMNRYLNGSCAHVEATEPLRSQEVLGWSALVKPHIYTFGARAEEKTRLIAFEAAALRELLDDNPYYGYQVITRIAEVIGQRLTSKYIQLLSLVLDAQGVPIWRGQ